MLGSGDPVTDDLLKLLGRHAGMRGYHDRHDGRFAACESALHVAPQQRGEGLFGLPFGMSRGERLHAVEREQELEIHRLLGPKRAIIVEGGDALGLWHKVR